MTDERRLEEIRSELARILEERNAFTRALNASPWVGKHGAYLLERLEELTQLREIAKAASELDEMARAQAVGFVIHQVRGGKTIKKFRATLARWRGGREKVR